MFVAECVENVTAFKPNQKDNEGNPLPLGSIEIRIGAHQSNLGQIRNCFCRPCTWNRRIPLIGEQVFVISAPVNDWSTSGEKGIGFLYFAPINSTDDLVMHVFPKLWSRKGLVAGGSAGERLIDRDEVGRVFPKTPPKTINLQPFEGDDLFEGRLGQSIRFGSTVTGGDMSVFEQKPTWKGSKNADPLMILRVKKPEGSGNKNSSIKKFYNQNSYTIEDLSSDEANIYLATTQTLNKLKGGFDKNLDVKKIGNYQGKGQIAVDSERVVINAKKDMLFLIGAEKAILTGKKVLFQSEKYKVDLDDLMDFLQDWLKQDSDLAAGKASYSTACGPSSVATNVSSYIQLQSVDFNKFKQP